MRWRISVIALLAGFWGVSGTAHGDGYSFSKFIELSATPYTNLYAPTLNNNGEVLLSVLDSDSYTPLVRTDGSSAVEIAGPDTGFFPGLPNWPSFDDAGNVAFRAYSYSDGAKGIFLYSESSGSWQRLDSGYSEIASTVAMNDSGQVAYKAKSADGSTWSVFLHDGTSATVIADDTGSLDTLSAPAVNNYGEVAFHAEEGSTDRIYLGTSSGLTTIAESGGLSFSYIDPMFSMNGAGEIAFAAYHYWEGGYGIYDKTGAAITTPGEFSNIESISLNGADEVAFKAERGSEEGLYVARGGAVETVVELGDPLFGSTLAGFDPHGKGFSEGGLNDSGELAFKYYLNNGESGIAIATPTGGPEVPSPSALVGLLGMIGVAVALPRRRRGRR